MPNIQNNRSVSGKSLLSRVGMPPTLAWGYLGVLIFMMGDGLELGWLSPHLVNRGLSIEQSATLFTVYGITIAISSWFSGVLSEGFGIKRTMFLGLILYLLERVPTKHYYYVDGCGLELKKRGSMWTGGELIATFLLDLDKF